MVKLRSAQQSQMPTYETSKNEMKELANAISQQLKQDRSKFASFSIDEYHRQQQPSGICKILATAVNIGARFDNDGNGIKLQTIRNCKHAKTQIETKFRGVFERECKDVMMVRSNFYQHRGRVRQCRELVESLDVGKLKSQLETTLNTMTTKFTKSRKQEDDKILKSFKSNSVSFVDFVRSAKNVVLGVLTHNSTLKDFDTIYNEYLKRIEYNDQNMTSKLASIIVMKVRNECNDVKRYVSTNELFDMKSDSVNNLHTRINEFSNIVSRMLADDNCEERLRRRISDMIMQMHDSIKRQIEKCQQSVQMEFKQIEMIQRWFSQDKCKQDGVNHVTQLAMHILRLLSGLMYYHTVLTNILPHQLQTINVNEIRDCIGQLFDEHFEKWYDKINELVDESYFDGAIPYLETVSIFEKNDGMKQIRASTFGTWLKEFGGGNISLMIKNHLEAKKAKIIDCDNGLGIIIGGDALQSMKMRIERYEEVKEILVTLRSSQYINKYLDTHNDSQIYQQCISSISKQIKTAAVKIASEFETELSEKSFVNINHLFSNLRAVARVGVFDSAHSKDNHRLKEHIHSVRKKISTKLREIGKQASSKNASFNEIKLSMINLQMAKHTLTDSRFFDMITKAMNKAMVAQKKRYGVLTLSQLFTDQHLNETDKYWCDEIVNAFPIFSGAVTHSFNTKHGKHARDINSALNNTLAGKIGNIAVGSEEKQVLTQMYTSFNDRYQKLVKKYTTDYEPIIRDEEDIRQIVAELRGKIQQKTQKYDRRCSNNYSSDFIIELMSHIFCMWTLLDSQHFFEMKEKYEEQKYDTQPPRMKQSISVVSVDYDLLTESYASIPDFNELTSDETQKYTQELYSVETCETYLRKPKATQILAIMRLFGLAANNHTQEAAMESHLIEIKTGEGKSLVLAVSACIIAFLGFDVYCVCYGELLTQRDYHEFEDLFIELGVERKIRYGMYGDICSILITAKYGIHTKMLEMLSKSSKYSHNLQPNSSHRTWDAEHTILLVDEVDVFFDKRYFGRNYRQFVKLTHNCISQLMDEIWGMHKGGILYNKMDIPLDDGECKDNMDINEMVLKKNMEKIKALDSYCNCKDTFGFWMPVIDNEIELMVTHVQAFDTHHYMASNDGICYYQEDTITYDSRYGYRTMFAFYKEHERSQISKQSLENEKGINLVYASVSYAELPLEFMCVAGVTGTLSELEISRKDILENKYKLNKFTYIPTMFKETGLTFDMIDDVHLVDDNKWHQAIAEEIVKQMRQDNERLRPILVFFETNYDLQSFYAKTSQRNRQNDAIDAKDDIYLPNNCQLSILNEELTVNEKIKVIKDACRLNMVTLCTRIFGRGTDFIVIDDRVNDMGGPHVIQTFFSFDISEEVQIKGRTARNGGNGSFSMILNKFKYNAVAEDLSIYQMLSDYRDFQQKVLNQRLLKKVDEMKVHHDNTQQITDYLQTQDKQGVLKCLTELSCRR